MNCNFIKSLTLQQKQELRKLLDDEPKELLKGCTIDLRNQLVWGPTYKKLTWSQAMDLQKDGWSVPAKDQLKQALENEVPGLEKIGYWSSSSHVDNPEYAWFVHFYNGRVSYDDKGYDYAVRCVRPLGSWVFKEIDLKDVTVWK